MAPEEFEKFKDKMVKRVIWRRIWDRVINNTVIAVIALAVALILGGAIYLNVMAIRACGWGGWFIYGKNIYWAYFWGWCGS